MYFCDGDLNILSEQIFSCDEIDYNGSLSEEGLSTKRPWVKINDKKVEMFKNKYVDHVQTFCRNAVETLCWPKTTTHQKAVLMAK